MHIENEDPENLFCLSFQTLPATSDGVAHILEHTVLCGSQKFPIKDPFFSMSRRSLNTFMNALTGSDFTCYPAASQVPKDFYNLLEVYLDAVFHPSLNRLSFLQEGHRLEFAKANDPSSTLERKGIVYNEMKGALSSASARLFEAVNAALFPDVLYGINSGGDPKEIPNLTYERLKEFHQTYYHPSRCLFFFYGDMPLKNHLDFILQQTLSQTEPAAPLPSIPLQPRFKDPIYHHCFYPLAPTEEKKGKSLISFTWLTCHILEQQTALALHILEIALLDTDASPLKMALMESDLCKQVTAFIDAEINEIPIGIILKGCHAEDADALEKVLFDTLKKIAEQGVASHLIENAIHQLEFHGSEITGDHHPFGLSLFMRSALLKQHGASAELGLMMHTLFAKIREQFKENPRFFSDLILHYFVNNRHFARIVMEPDSSLGKKEAETEEKELAAIKAKLTEEEKKALVAQAKELAAFQKMQEEQSDLDLLPTVHLSDVPLLSKDFLLKRETFDNLHLFHHDVFTNGITYADFVLELPFLSREELPYLRLFTLVLTQMGCADRSYIQNLELMQANTGGVYAGISLNLQADNHHAFYPTFHLKGKALNHKTVELFTLLKEFLVSARLDDYDRLQELLEKHYTMLETRLNQSALKYAVNLSASAISTPGQVANDLYGLNYYLTVKKIVKNFQIEGPRLLKKLLELQQRVLHLNSPHFVISCEEKIYQELKKEKFYGLNALPSTAPAAWKTHSSLSSLNSQGRFIASPVAFIGKVFPTVCYTHQDAPALNIAGFLFDNLTLHRKIREQGGAYGGGAVSNALSGNFYFYSYRDPNVATTLQAFEEAVQRIVKGDFHESDLEAAKLEMIQAWDNPISPGSQAEVAYGWLREGKTFELRQKFRSQTLALDKEDIIQAVKRHILPNLHQGINVVFGGKDLLEKANRELAASKVPTLELLSI